MIALQVQDTTHHGLMNDSNYQQLIKAYNGDMLNLNPTAVVTDKMVIDAELLVERETINLENLKQLRKYLEKLNELRVKRIKETVEYVKNQSKTREQIAHLVLEIVKITNAITALESKIGGYAGRDARVTETKRSRFASFLNSQN